MPLVILGFRPDAETLKYGGSACVLAALAVLAAVAASNPDSPVNVQWKRYNRYLDKRLRELFLVVNPASIAGGQLLALLAISMAWSFLGLRASLALTFASIFGPALYLYRQKRRRLRALELQVEPFLLALTNALRTTSSIASALAIVETLMSNPMREELSLVLKELRVGSTIDQAILAMAARTRVDDLDAALSALLIGRQVGGNLTEILETTARTLREMARLKAVLRSKTNSGRVQFVSLAIAPLIIVGTFQYANPGYFDPLLKNFAGAVVLLVSAGLWLVAIGMARKVLATSL